MGVNESGKTGARPRIHPVRMTACDEHLKGAAEIERLCFSSPWSADSLALLTRDGIGVGFVCLADGRVVAYGGMICTVDEGQITNVAVHPDYRRRGMGDALVRALIRYAKDERMDTVTLEVRASNQAAISLYRRNGFVEVGRRKAFYTKPTEDAVLMTVKVR